MKKPEEIKKGLVEAIEEASWAVERGDAHDLIDAVDNTLASMANALAYIQQLEAQVPRWIPVEERLPATDDDVLIVTNNEFGTGYEVGQGYYDICDEEWFGHAYVGTIDVTHWMPLPEAPKEDAQ